MTTQEQNYIKLIEETIKLGRSGIVSEQDIKALTWALGQIQSLEGLKRRLK